MFYRRNVEDCVGGPSDKLSFIVLLCTIGSLEAGHYSNNLLNALIDVSTVFTIKQGESGDFLIFVNLRLNKLASEVRFGGCTIFRLRPRRNLEQ